MHTRPMELHVATTRATDVRVFDAMTTTTDKDEVKKRVQTTSTKCTGHKSTKRKTKQKVAR
jgi:hypothetical protein